jgi:uncharacterized protein (TIGR02996 family)
VPRRPKPGPTGSPSPAPDVELTEKRPMFDPPGQELHEDEPRDSLSELTIRRPQLDEHDDLEPTVLRKADRMAGALADEDEPPPTPSLAAALAAASELEVTEIEPAEEDSLAAATLVRGVRPDSEPSAGVSLVDLEPTTLHAPPTRSGLEDRPTVHLSPAESGLLAAIAEGHEPSRLRYADWLDRRGEPARAELLRLDHALHAMRADDPRFIPTLQRIRALAPRVSIDWRSRVSRAAIEGCGAYGVTCPTYWRALPATADDVRTCPACHDKVYYCATLPLAQERVQQGQCVAIDATCERWPNDLVRQCDGCGGAVTPQSRFCTSCGTALPRARSLGYPAQS